MCWSINKQNPNVWVTLPTKSFFCNILTCMDNYNGQFFVFKPSSHCLGVRPSVSRQFVTGRSGWTGTIPEMIRVRARQCCGPDPVCGKQWLHYRHSPVATVLNLTSTGKSQGYAGSPPWHTVAKPAVTVSPPWTQLMLVLLQFHPLVLRWRIESCRKSHGDPRKKPVLFRSSVGPGESRLFNKIKTTRSRWSPVEHGLFRFNGVQLGPNRSDAGLKTGTMWTRRYGSMMHCLSMVKK